MRKPNVRWFESRQGFYCQVNGRQYRLGNGPNDAPAGPNYEAARQAYLRLLNLGQVGTAKDRNSIRALLETYLDWIQRERSPGTYKLRRKAFVPFCDVCGETAVGDLTHFRLDQFIATMRQPRPHATHRGRMVMWTDTSVRMFVDSINAAFSWAIGRKLITANPVAGYEVRPAHSRTAACCIGPDKHQCIMATVMSEGLRNFLTCAEHTGARPSELLAATARDWHDDMGALVYLRDDRRRTDGHRHKTAGHSDRVIYFDGPALDLMRALVRRYPTGSLFRTRQGKPWTDILLRKAFMRLRRELNDPDLVPYGYRHQLATRWIEEGGSIDLLAQVLGNGVDVIRRTYSHVKPTSGGVRAALAAFRGGK